MKKGIITAGVLMVLAVPGWGQEKYNASNTLRDLLDTLVQLDTININHSHNLVSQYTFRNLVKKDFSLITTGSDNNTQVGKYAALSIDKNSQTVSFSPINYASASYRFIINTNINAKVNGDGIFNLKNRKQLKWNISGVIPIWKRYYYNNQRPSNTTYDTLYAEVANKLRQKLNNPKDTLESIENKALLNDKKALETTYHKDVEKYENLMTQNAWTVKKLFWLKIDVGYAGDNFNIVDTNSPSSIQTPISKTINSFAAAFTGNAFITFKKGFSIYGNVKISGTTKTSLSEITSSKEWNKIQLASAGNDSIFYNVDNKDVYLFDASQFHRRFMFDWSAQVLIFFPVFFKNNSMGIDFNFQNNAFITPNTRTFKSSKDIFSVGIAFPLKDKNGVTNINIEPFYQYAWYNQFDLGKDEDFWGIKFGVPLNQLF